MSKLEQLLQVLPQTQCGLCQHTGCKPYAKALLNGTDTIDKCHPGGLETLNNLGKILAIDPKPYTKTVAKRTITNSAIYIDQSTCIGCTKCIQACPVDAIIGTAKANHIVITSECTGCNLCLPVCPVDCMHEKTKAADTNPVAIASYRRSRYEQRNQRLMQLSQTQKNQHKNNKDLIKQRLKTLSINKEKD